MKHFSIFLRKELATSHITYFHCNIRYVILSDAYNKDIIYLFIYFIYLFTMFGERNPRSGIDTVETISGNHTNVIRKCSKILEYLR